MNLESFFEDYYNHVLEGCQFQKCLYEGCKNNERKVEFMEDLRSDVEGLTNFLAVLLEKMDDEKSGVKVEEELLPCFL